MLQNTMQPAYIWKYWAHGIQQPLWILSMGAGGFLKVIPVINFESLCQISAC